MTTRTSPALKQAFKCFVELVKPIEDVQYVVAFDDEETLFYTKRVLASLLAYDALYAELPKSEAASLPKRARGR